MKDAPVCMYFHGGVERECGQINALQRECLRFSVLYVTVPGLEQAPSAVPTPPIAADATAAKSLSPASGYQCLVGKVCNLPARED